MTKSQQHVPYPRKRRVLAGAHPQVRARQPFPVLGALTVLLAVQYSGVLLLSAALGEKLSALIAGGPGKNW